MSGKCKDEERFNVIPSEFHLKAAVYDFDERCYDEDATELIVDVDMIDYKCGHIWYGNGFKSANFKLFFADKGRD